MKCGKRAHNANNQLMKQELVLVSKKVTCQTWSVYNLSKTGIKINSTFIHKTFTQARVCLTCSKHTKLSLWLWRSAPLSLMFVMVILFCCCFSLTIHNYICAIQFLNLNSHNDHTHRQQWQICRFAEVYWQICRFAEVYWQICRFAEVYWQISICVKAWCHSAWQNK